MSSKNVNKSKIKANQYSKDGFLTRYGEYFSLEEQDIDYNLKRTLRKKMSKLLQVANDEKHADWLEASREFDKIKKAILATDNYNLNQCYGDHDDDDDCTQTCEE